MFGRWARSVVSGVIYGRPNTRVILRSAAFAADAYTDDQGRFRMENLPAGLYRLSAPGTDIVRPGIKLDGSNHVTLQVGRPPAPPALDASRPEMQPKEKQTPKQEAPAVDAPHQSAISGQVRHGAGRTIILKGPEGKRSAQIGEDERYRFEGLGPGRYYVRVQDTLLRRGGLMMNGRNHRQVNFAIPAAQPSHGAICGQDPGGGGAQLYVRGLEGNEILHPLDEDGRFEIDGLKAGAYLLILHTPAGEATERVTLDGFSRQEVHFNLAMTPPPATAPAPTPEPAPAAAPKPGGWAYQVEELGPGPGYGLVRVRVHAQKGQAVRLWTKNWPGMVRLTGHNPALGADVCEFAPLGAGLYHLQVAGNPQRIQVQVTGSREIWVTLQPNGAST